MGLGGIGEEGEEEDEKRRSKRKMRSRRTANNEPNPKGGEQNHLAKNLPHQHVQGMLDQIATSSDRYAIRRGPPTAWDNC